MHMIGHVAVRVKLRTDSQRREELAHVAQTRHSQATSKLLARGKLAILDGDPGTGKSLLAVDLIARLSRDGRRPGHGPPGQMYADLLNKYGRVDGKRIAAPGAGPEKGDPQLAPAPPHLSAIESQKVGAVASQSSPGP